ncbi:phosphopantetheine-binding protein [Kribbella sp. NBC_01245]|uniref:phosphopantetheine-binding protein n=1 Tax=Kribbella sp. NBC_01245 TaxID=2903578 RepID=UPI002E2A6595|nr:phosphopantetheine-binding protein [Kribbella sp. NBC_01245]
MSELTRADVLELLAGLGDREVDAERIDSMELAWFVHQVEQRFGVEFDDTRLDRIRTVTDAVAVLNETLRVAGENETLRVAADG